MKVFVAFFAALCLTGVSGIKWKNLHLKFDILGGYYDIALELAELERLGKFTFMVTDEDLNIDFYSYPNDPRVAVAYDMYGRVAGIRTGYIKSDVGTKAASNDLTFPTELFDNNTMYGTATYWGQEVWYNTVLFARPDQLINGTRSETKGVVGENVYIKIDGEWTRMPRNEQEAEALGFFEQACFVGMGKHYFYKLSSDAECADAPGIFLLYEGGEMIGLGLIPYGSFTNGDEMKWFENPSASVAKMIAPNSPECMADWFNNYGSSSLHIFFKKYPRMTLCLC